MKNRLNEKPAIHAVSQANVENPQRAYETLEGPEQAQAARNRLETIQNLRAQIAKGWQGAPSTRNVTDIIKAKIHANL